MTTPICLPKTTVFGLDHQNEICGEVEQSALASFPQPSEPVKPLPKLPERPYQGVFAQDQSKRIQTILLPKREIVVLGAGCNGATLEAMVEPSAPSKPSQPENPQPTKPPTIPTLPQSTPPELQEVELHAETPCGANGVLTDLDERYGVCSNLQTQEHHLFTWDPEVKGSVSSLIPLSYRPDQLFESSSGKLIISFQQDLKNQQAAGITIVDPEQKSESHLPFPIVTLTAEKSTSTGENFLTSFTPNFPKGITEAEGKIFVATSNLRDSQKGEYFPGTVLVTHGGGNFEVIETEGYNPTSVGVVNGLLVVVCSGAFDTKGKALTESTLEIFDPVTHARLQTVSLGYSAAGISGELRVSEEGKRLVLPTGDNSGDLLVVDLENLSVAPHSLKNNMASEQIFFSGLQMSVDGRYSLINNLNDGHAYLVDLNSGKMMGAPLTIDSNLTDSNWLGDVVRIGRDFYLGLGGQILQVKTN